MKIEQRKERLNSLMEKLYFPPGVIVGYKGTVFSFLQDALTHISMSFAARSTLGLCSIILEFLIFIINVLPEFLLKALCSELSHLLGE